MYCTKCGKEINDEAVVCIHCGCAVKPIKGSEQTVEKKLVNEEYNKNKTGLGIVCGIFLGLIGIIIGLCVYPEGSIARKSFLKSWLITIIVVTVIPIIIFLILFFSVSINDYYNNLIFYL